MNIFVRRSNFAPPAALAAALLLLLAPAANAQSPNSALADGNLTVAGPWSAWIGCWEPVDARTPGAANPARAATGVAASPSRSASPSGASAKASDAQAVEMVCLLPTNAENAVELVTVAGREIVDRTLIDASGDRRERTFEGCSGWEMAEWSADRRRVYLNSEYTCAGDLERRTSGIIAIVPGDQWLQVESITVGEHSAGRGLRYRAVRRSTIPEGLPAEIVAALPAGQSMAARTARLAAAGPIDIAAVIEAAGQLDQVAVQGWLVEQAQAFDLDADKLIELDNAGVAPELIDLMVAIAYPEVFQIDRTPHSAGFDVAEAPSRPSPGTGNPPIGGGRYLDPFGYYAPGYYGFGIYSPLRYGYGYGFGYDYGWYPGRTPIIIRVKDSGEDRDKTPRRRGRVVNGRGYTRGGLEADEDRTGRRSSNGATRPPWMTATPDRSNTGINRSSSPGTRSTPARTAKPRDPKRSGS